MASPIAGNESFTNVENLTGQVPVLDVNELNVSNLLTETSTVTAETRISALKPSLEGLTVAAVTGSVTYAANTISVSDYDGSAAVSILLPAATAGTVVVHAQGVDTNHATAADLTFNCAGTDVWFTGSNIRTTTGGFDTSVADETQLVYTPEAGGATTNLLTVGCKIYFWCVSDGTWHIAADLSTEPAVATGEFAFAA